MNSNFSVDRESLGSVEAVGVSGELDQATVPELRSALDGALEQADAAVFIDLSDCEFIDSTGLSLLVEAQRRCAERDRGFAVCCARPEVARLLELTGIDSAIRLFATRDEAIASLDSGQPAG